jgi:hypothetical protein
VNHPFSRLRLRPASRLPIAAGNGATEAQNPPAGRAIRAQIFLRLVAHGSQVSLWACECDGAHTSVTGLTLSSHEFNGTNSTLCDCSMGEEQMFLKLSKEIGECYRLAAEGAGESLCPHRSRHSARLPRYGAAMAALGPQLYDFGASDGLHRR